MTRRFFTMMSSRAFAWCQRAKSRNLQPRYGPYELRAPVTDARQLCLDFAMNIPWKNDDPLRLIRPQAIFVHDRNPAAGQILSLLCRAAVGHIRQEFTVDAREVEKRIALRGRPIGTDLAACFFLLAQEGKEFSFRGFGTRLKT